MPAPALAPQRAWGDFVAAGTTLSGIGFAREYAYIEPTPMRRMIAEP
ncbi:hypothetical protein [Methylocystis suflitae]|nr:hypothetical protein [Methylocystis suflitae]MCQ4190644.1 hypothetical protein [Methylocystis suflitae]